MTNNKIDINNLIKENYNIPESIFDTKRTKTSHFMLQSIFSNSSISGTEFFVNAFLKDDNYNVNFPRPIFILFKVKSFKDPKWNFLLDKLRSKPEYMLEYFCGVKDNYNLIMIVFQVPDKYAKDYLLFKAGKYSKFSEGYKKLFSQYNYDEKGVPQESIIWKVVTKHSSLKKELEKFFTVHPARPFKFSKEDELWGIPEPTYEYYRYNKKECKKKDCDTTVES